MIQPRWFGDLGGQLRLDEHEVEDYLRRAKRNDFSRRQAAARRLAGRISRKTAFRRAAAPALAAVRGGR